MPHRARQGKRAIIAKLFDKLCNNMGISADKYSSDRELFRVRVLLAYSILASISWSIWGFVYSVVLVNPLAEKICMVTAGVTALTLLLLKLRVPTRFCELYMIVSCQVMLLSGAFSLGGIKSISHYWLMVVVIAAYLLLKRRGGIWITTTTLTGLLIIFAVQEFTDIQSYYFSFNMDDTRYRTYAIINMGSCILLASIFLLVFDQQVSEAYQRVSQVNDIISEQNRNITAILRNISSGIFSINEDGKIQAEYSNYLAEKFQISDLQDQNYLKAIFSLSDLSDDETSQLNTILLGSIDCDPLQFYANEYSLPNELSFQLPDSESRRIFEVYYDTIVANDVVKRILINLKDVTLSRELQKRAEERNAKLKKVFQILEIGEMKADVFFRSAHQIVSRCHEQIRLWNEKSHIIVFESLHTLKGNARNLGLTDISALTHKAEEYLITIEDTPTAVFANHIQSIHQQLEDYHEAYKEVFHQKMREADLSRSDEIAVLASQHLNTMNAKGIQSTATFHKILQLIPEFSTSCSVDYFSRFQQELAVIAKDLNKPAPQLHVRGDQVYLAGSCRIHLLEIMGHLLRNAMDHGIETVERRLETGKPGAGQIYVTIKIEGDDLSIEMHDDGGGLCLASIKRKAKEMGLIQGDETESELANLILHEGFSTKGTVSEISGRGVGMSAVKNLAESLGASMELHLVSKLKNSDNYRFSISILLPHSLWSDLQFGHEERAYRVS